MIWKDIENAINLAQDAHPAFRVRKHTPLGGGCINDAYKVSDGERCYFVKTNRAALRDMFEAEMAGLNEIHASASIRAPLPIATGVSGQSAFLVLEHLDLRDSKIDDALLGQHLAAMHAHHQDQFGWFRDNTIGSTLQRNTHGADWPRFWRQHRLGFQLELAARNGYTGDLQRQGEKLLDAIPLFFAAYQPAPSLLHGDLWSGNVSGLSDGAPVIFDPAVYYGDRETDLAMTELFGGFSPRFYAAYNECAPLDAGYKTRKTLYNLYHILNHANLFGGGYRAQSEAMIGKLLAELN